MLKHYLFKHFHYHKPYFIRYIWF